jgi:hypothetical protein
MFSLIDENKRIPPFGGRDEIMISFKIVKGERNNSINSEGGILFIDRSCMVDGDVHAKGPIIALGDLNIKGRIGSEVCIMVAGDFSVEERIDTFFLVASNLKCRGRVQVLSIPLEEDNPPLKGLPDHVTPFIPAYEFWEMMVMEKELCNVHIWNKMRVGEVLCGGRIICGKEIRSSRGIEAFHGIECGGDIISGGNIAGEFIESKGEIISGNDIFGGEYIKANEVIKAKNRIEAREIYAGLQMKDSAKPSIIARKVIGVIKHGTPKIKRS